MHGFRSVSSKGRKEKVVGVECFEENMRKFFEAGQPTDNNGSVNNITSNT